MRGGREAWIDPVTGKPDGTYLGSQAGNLLRSASQIASGLGGAQAVLFDYDLKKFKVNVNPGTGKKNFQIIGKDAEELSKDLDLKYNTMISGTLGNTIIGSMSKGISSSATKARAAIPSVKLEYSPVPQKPAAPPSSGFSQKSLWSPFRGGKTARKGRKARRGTRRN